MRLKGNTSPSQTALIHFDNENDTVIIYIYISISYQIIETLKNTKLICFGGQYNRL